MHKLIGVHTAIVTPFDENFKVNEEVLRQHIAFQLKMKVDGLIILGTTGETPTLTAYEKQKIIEIAIDENNKNKNKAFLSIGTGCYSTAATIENTKKAEDKGADAALVVTPYYNKPTQEGLYRHFKAVAEAVTIPIIIYNIAGRTGQNLQTETLKRLSEIENIVGVKEASGNILQMMDVYAHISENRPDFCLLCGDDALTLPAMTIGATGVISVVSNLVPALVVELIRRIRSYDLQGAKELHYQLLPLFKGAFLETNPIPIKYAMNMLGMNVGGCRLPLCEMSEANVEALTSIVMQYKCEKQNVCIV
jgi:4-hydroxy-tetrahydrodipicolinate synthase